MVAFFDSIVDLRFIGEGNGKDNATGDLGTGFVIVAKLVAIIDTSFSCAG
jgi:hypothetical protein